MGNKKAGSSEERLSVFLSLVLRHQPEAAGITLDEHGWADVEDIVRTDEKGRYSFNEDRTLIRANQGHSIPVDVELTETAPPQVLYHGTASRFEQAILEQGLKPMSRLYVHLSGDAKTALTVGRRHGNPVVFEVDSGRMSRDGEHFYISQNGVWLTKRVKPEYLKRNI